MSQKATGNLTIYNTSISFVGTDEQGRNVSGIGSVIPAVAAPGVNWNNAILTYDDYHTLPGKHDFKSGHVGKNDALVLFKQTFGETNPITFTAPCTQNDRTDLAGGLIRFD